MIFGFLKGRNYFDLVDDRHSLEIIASQININEKFDLYGNIPGADYQYVLMRRLIGSGRATELQQRDD